MGNFTGKVAKIVSEGLKIMKNRFIYSKNMHIHTRKYMGFFYL